VDLVANVEGYKAAFERKRCYFWRLMVGAWFRPILDIQRPGHE